MYKVYKHTNLENEKVYIGITGQSTSERWRNGKGYLTQKNGGFLQPKFANAIIKYGWENFSHEILFEFETLDDATKKETELISEYDSIENGYNEIMTNKNSYIKDESFKQKLSEKYSGEGNPMFGKHHTEEFKKELSKMNSGKNNPMYGRKLSEETKMKISEASKRRWSAIPRTKKEKIIKERKHVNPMQGKHHSEKTKKLISQQKLGKKNLRRSENIQGENNPKAKAVYCIEDKKLFMTMKEAGKVYGVTGPTISLACYNPKRTAAKRHWRFASSEEVEKHLTNE